jgi:phosphate acetyltransferase
MKLLDQIIENARKNNKRIVLPEGSEPRTLKAAEIILKEKIAQLILLGNPKDISETAHSWI